MLLMIKWTIRIENTQCSYQALSGGNTGNENSFRLTENQNANTHFSGPRANQNFASTRFEVVEGASKFEVWIEYQRTVLEYHKML